MLTDNSTNYSEITLVTYGIVLGFLLSLISGVFIPIISNFIGTKIKLKNFKKQLKLDIENLKNIIASELSSFNDYYNTELFKNNIGTGYLIHSNNPPDSLVRQFNSDVYRKNWGLYVLLDNKIQGKINHFYSRVETLNLYPQLYKDIPIDKIKNRQNAMENYLETLKLAHIEAKEILTNY